MIRYAQMLWAVISGVLLAALPLPAQDEIELTDKKKEEPVPVLQVTESNPYYWNSSIEFYDVAGELWPAFYVARGATANGSFVPDLKNPKGSFTIKGQEMAMKGGCQDRRIIGELVRTVQEIDKQGNTNTVPKEPPVSVTISSFGPMQTFKPTKGTPQNYWEVEGTIDFDGKQLSAKGKASFGVRKVMDNISRTEVLASAPMHIEFIKAGKDLGLKTHADKQVKILVFTEAFPRPATADEVKAVRGGPKVEEATDVDDLR